MKKQSLSQRLFRTYAGWFLLSMFVIMCISVWYVASVISQNNEDTQRQLMKSLGENVENYFEEMNTFSIELMNSVEFKNTAISELPGAVEEGKSTSQYFSKLYRNAYKMIQKHYKVGVIADGSYYIWMGDNYYINKIEGSPITTYDSMIRDEKPVVKYLEQNEYLVHTANDRYEEEKEREYITLSRSMDRIRKYVNGRTILEVQVDAEDFRTSMSGISGSRDGHGMQLNLFNSDGEPLYLESQMDLSGYVDQEDGLVFHQHGSMIMVHKVFDGRITVVYTINKAEYNNKLMSFLGLALLMGIVVFGAITFITYHISRQISRPIHSMCESVEAINLEKGILYQEVDSNIYELEFLSDTLHRMSVELGDSLEHIIALKDYELHARMLALQAQMQPHFLFNTLTTIGTMAEEEGNRRISSMCTNLTQMFRYIAADSGKGVRIFEEMRQVERYVEIMKERFPNSRVILDIPLELMDCIIPKLTIQPLVENAFKYCNRQQAVITVKGRVADGDRWEIVVEDNGNGFTEEKIEEIMGKCREGLKESKALSSQIDGMGLVNVFVRLKLSYGENMTYRMEAGKGMIMIGGTRNAGK